MFYIYEKKHKTYWLIEKYKTFVTNKKPRNKNDDRNKHIPANLLYVGEYKKNKDIYCDAIELLPYVEMGYIPCPICGDRIRKTGKPIVYINRKGEQVSTMSNKNIYLMATAGTYLLRVKCDCCKKKLNINKLVMHYLMISALEKLKGLDNYELEAATLVTPAELKKANEDIEIDMEQLEAEDEGGI